MNSRHDGKYDYGSTVESKDCSNEQCPGTALWDTACKDYVCSRCHTHHKGPCRVCDWRETDEGYIVDPEEAMRGT